MSQKVRSQKLEVKSSERGQVLLIVILVVIVSLTIGLSLASRGITNLRTSTEEADSQKALAAAEAEIEKRLQDTTTGTFTGAFGSSTFTTNVDSQGGEAFLVNGGSLITQGEGVDIWFAEHNSDGSINYSTVKTFTPNKFFIFWGGGNETNCISSDPSTWPAAIEVIVVSGDPPGIPITTTHYAYDFCIARGNNFYAAESQNVTIGDKAFKIRTRAGVNSIDITNTIFMRVVPLYKSTIIGVRACTVGGGGPCNTLPSQGYEITSTGTTGTASRKLKVFKGHEQIFLPYISYGLFVPTR